VRLSGARGDLAPRDAALYVAASTIGSFGLGVTAFYLNFLYRALGLDDAAIGALAGALALGGVAGAAPAALLARRFSRRAALLIGGSVTAAGIVGILAFDTFWPLVGAAALLGCGGIVVASSGAALIADATVSGDRAAMFGRQIAFGTTSAFLAAVAAGALASPVAGALGQGVREPLVIRALIAGGGIIAAASALPVLFVRAPRVPRGGHERRVRLRLLSRFLVLEVAFGFGAGSFLPFVNLFFTDRFRLDFLGVGVALGVIAVGGSLGALLHARVLVPRLGALRAVVAVELASLPFALLAAFAAEPWLAVAALATRALLMYGASATFSSFIHSSFAPAERAGSHAALQLFWGAGSAAGAIVSGLLRAAFGPAGYTVNLLMLAFAYLVAALLTLVLFRSHEPRGDAMVEAAPHSTV
jgi:MFS family permease